MQSHYLEEVHSQGLSRKTFWDRYCHAAAHRKHSTSKGKGPGAWWRDRRRRNAPPEAPGGEIADGATPGALAAPSQWQLWPSQWQLWPSQWQLWRYPGRRGNAKRISGQRART